MKEEFSAKSVGNGQRSCRDKSTSGVVRGKDTWYS